MSSRVKKVQPDGRTNRRQVLKGALAVTGAALSGNVSTGVASAAPSAVPQAALVPQAAAGAWTPALFDAHQNETLVALTDLIIPATDTPGAQVAKVNEYIDLILSEGRPERARRFLEGIGWLDGIALDEHDRPFIKLTSSQQTAILNRLAAEAETDEAPTPGGRFFREIKRLTVAGYYSSKIGIDELNKDGRVPDTFACS